jgi:hypothetical protein
MTSVPSGGDNFRPFLFEYRYAGGIWGFEVLARSVFDARARLSAMANAELKGPVALSVPVRPGLLASQIARLRSVLYAVYRIFA